MDSTQFLCEGLATFALLGASVGAPPAPTGCLNACPYRAAAKHAAAAGSEFIKLPPMDSSHLSAAARDDEAELRWLTGERLVASSGKLALLDRLLLRSKAAGSRALIFSQYTLSLDVLEEYAR